VLPALLRPEGVETLVTWVITGGGFDQFPTPGGCAVIKEASCGFTDLRNFHIFLPFYDAAILFDGSDLSPWDMTNNKSSLNPTGLLGTWLNADSAIPGIIEWNPDDVGLGFDNDADATIPRGNMLKARVFHTLTQLGGEDGIVNTPDDRILVTGGGENYITVFGGDVISLSCEVFLPPGANGL
jgi:hypothetical protein